MRAHIIGALAMALSVATGSVAAAQSTDLLIRGTVVDEDGHPISGADVELTCASGRRRGQTSPIGGFLLRSVPSGDCALTASRGGRTSATIPVSGAPGSGPAPVLLTLDAGRFVEQVVVTPMRGFAEAASRIPESATVTNSETLQQRPFTLLGQALREQPGVMLQQTTTAQVSPVIRGFTGQSNLYLVDGVRLNQSTWRSGPSQYFAWIDAFAIERMEVVRGAGSLQYGSDGLGGAIQLLPARPTLGAAGSGIRWGGVVDVTAASGDRMGGGRALIELQSPTFSANVSLGATSVGDLRPGGGRDSRAAVTRFLGLPSSLKDGRLPRTGFDMRSGHANIVGRVGTGGVVSGTYLMQTQSDVRRYDRIDGGEGLHDSGFTPQRLDLALLRYEADGGRAVDRWSATISMNRQEDGRYEQARPTSRRDRQSSVATAWGYQLQGYRFWGGRHQTMAGVELYDESVSAERTLIESGGTVTQARPDIPDGTGYRTFGAFTQHVATVWGDRLTLRGGARYSRFRFSTSATPALGVLDDAVVADAMTFQGGAVLRVFPSVSFAVNASRGFRAGNSADLASIGLTGGGGFEISPGRAEALGAIVGSNEGTTAVGTGVRVGALTPEIADTYEASVKIHHGRLRASVAAFDIELRDAIQRRTIIVDSPVVGLDIAGFEIVRQDAEGRVYVAEDSRPVVTRVNLSKARIVGIDAEAAADFSDQWSGGAWFSLSNGRVPGGDYLRRMPPPLGGAQVRWQAGRYWVQGVVNFGARQSRFNSGDRSDARIGARRTASTIAGFFNGTATDIGLVSAGRLVATGETLAQVQARVLAGQSTSYLFTDTPGWTTIGLRAGWSPVPAVSLVLIGENLTDRNYRVHGSGVDSPGRSVQVRMSYRLGSRVTRRP